MSTLSSPGLSDPPSTAILLPPSGIQAQANKAPRVRDWGRLPLSFESNQGQTDSKVHFLTHSGDSTLFLTPSEAVFSMLSPANSPQQGNITLRKDRNARRSAQKRTRVALRMQMVGSNPRAVALTQEPLAGRINYLLGHDSRKWHTGVPTFGRVGFHEVYKGVDLIYYGNQTHLEYDFVVAPHADPQQIKLHFAGAQKVRVNTAGDLLICTQGHEMRWRKPTVYQQDATGKHSVAAHFRLTRLPSGQAGVSFALGRYDAERSLVIDPILLYSTYLGGSTDRDDFGFGITVDSTGSAYVTGEATSTDFPVTAGAFQTVNIGPGAGVSFITKLNPTGTALVYSTYFGGSNGASIRGSAVDRVGNLYVAGTTDSSDLPTTPGAFQTTKRSGNITNIGMVAKLNSTGNALLYCTYLGGSQDDDVFGLALGSDGSVTVAGQASSPDFPTTPGVFQPTTPVRGLGYSAFVAKLNAAGSALIYSTYLGGSQSTYALAVALDLDGNPCVAGQTADADFPTTLTAFQRTNKASSPVGTAFVSKLSANGSTLLASTFLGGSSGAYAIGVAVDGANSIYIAGNAGGADFPTTPGAFQTTTKTSMNSPFVTKLDANCTSLLYSTYLGGSGVPGGGDTVHGLTLDAAGDACVIGETFSRDFPTTRGAFQRVNFAIASGNQTAFLSKLNPTGTALLYSTYLGATGEERGWSLTVDTNGVAYTTGGTYSVNFPVTPGAFQPTKRAAPSHSNAFVTKLSTIPIFPDFNNDGHTDLLLQNASTNAIISWFMNGATFTGGAYFSLYPPSDYALVGAGDFGGAGLGITTLVFQSNTTNQILYWYTGGANDATITGGDYVNVTPPAGWKLVGIGDFNGDGKSDLVVQNQATYQIAIYFMSGPYYQGGVLLPYTPPVGWKVVGVGDFNGDGQADIAFQIQSTGQIALWYMHGTTYFNGLVMPTAPPSGWKVVAIGDYNGDGVADLVLQSPTSNQGMVWYLTSGGVLSSAQFSTRAPAGWNFAGPR